MIAVFFIQIYHINGSNTTILTNLYVILNKSSSARPAYGINNPEATEAALKWHADGQRWMHSGDIGYMTEDGHVYVVDRLKRAVRIGEELILPAKTERVLLAHAGVDKCAVIGNANAALIAHVVLKPGEDADSILPKLIQSCSETLPVHFRPARYIFCKSLPLTPVGKIDYRALERACAADHAGA